MNYIVLRSAEEYRGLQLGMIHSFKWISESQSRQRTVLWMTGSLGGWYVLVQSYIHGISIGEVHCAIDQLPCG